MPSLCTFKVGAKKEFYRNDKLIISNYKDYEIDNWYILYIHMYEYCQALVQIQVQASVPTGPQVE